MALMAAQPKLAVPGVPTATASFDPPVVRPGELTFLRVVLNALEESIEWPTNVAAPPQLEIRPGAHGQIFRMTGTNMEPRTAFNFRVRANSLGLFAVPEFVVKVNGHPVTVPSARLQVVSAPPESVPPAVELKLELPTTNLFVGQAVQARIVLPASPRGLVRGLGQPQLSGDGFLVDMGAVRQQIQMQPRGGAMVPSFIYEATLTPLMAGKLAVQAQGFTVGSYFFGLGASRAPPIIPPGLSQYTLLESEPAELNVRPLPQEGELPGFTGAVGSFSVGPPKLSASVVRVGDPVKLTVTITNRGDGPLARVVAPRPPKARDWQVFAGADFASAQPVVHAPPAMAPRFGVRTHPSGLQGVVTFTYALIPLTEAAQATPPIPFSCFDPKAGAYVDLTIPSVPVTVHPGSAPSDFATLLKANSAGGEPEKELKLCGLAPTPGRATSSLVPPQRKGWFPLVQLAPAVVFLGIWNWDRRRRYLETHPDIVLRRRARRALRGQRRVLRRAARASDSLRFATAAVNAMRVACAPHYPAEPRALVGGDVLPLLPEAERSSRSSEVVRRFFAATDAASFSTTPANAAELLPLQPDVEHVLEQLEQKL